MPITEGPRIDGRTAAVREFITWVKDSEDAQAPYREAHEARQAAEARRERMRAIARLPRKGQKRPWQTLGISAAEWRRRRTAAESEGASE